MDKKEVEVLKRARENFVRRDRVCREAPELPHVGCQLQLVCERSSID